MRTLAVFKLPALLGGIFLLVTGSSLNNFSGDIADCDEAYPVYTIQPGDKLYEIGIRYGDFRFWEAIYILNADLIDDPDLIYAGQQLEIPRRVHSFKHSAETPEAVLSNPFCDIEKLPVASVDESKISLYSLEYLKTEEYKSMVNNFAAQNARADSMENEDDKLAEFRKVFNAVMERQDDTATTGNDEIGDTLSNRDAIQRQSERRIMIEIDGMVLDETRSKIGRDFYDVFYSGWQSPEGASNFSIRIAEQPSPSLGTIIYVEVNDTETFRMRLQPRYDFIQQAGRYAVRQTYSYLQNNDHQLQIY